MDTTAHATSVTVSRRTALARCGALASLYALWAPKVVVAQATPVPPRQTPNTFRLSGDGVNITYASTSFDGQPTLSYRSAGLELEFRSSQIATEHSEILGDLVSVMIDSVQDGYSEWVTILIPPINVPEPTEPVPFSTPAISTRHHTPIGGPGMVNGQTFTYSVTPLEGVAELLFY